ncbi:MAG TPA: glycosyltransferase [Bryobacteraceae bacterium]
MLLDADYATGYLENRLCPRRKPRYRVVVRTDSELHWSSYFFCGLYQLLNERLLSVRFKPRLSLSPTEVFATAVEVTDDELQRTKKLVFDWRDNADLLCLRKLADCDMYFKRNLIPDVTYPACPAEYRTKLRPAGLSFAVRTIRERPLWAQMIGGLCCREEPLFSSSPSASLRRLYKSIRGPVNVRSFLQIDEFEKQASVADDRILYQARAYDADESTRPGDTREVTQSRADIIRRLKAELPQHFCGGFTRTPYTERHFADYVSAESSFDQSAYCTLARSCSICIYTRGLRDSPGFKLGEYLAGGKCIIAERIATVLPTPLIHGTHLLYFDTVEGLLEQCRAVLANHDLRDGLSRGALAYYRSEVAPRRRVLSMLAEAFKDEIPAASA